MSSKRTDGVTKIMVFGTFDILHPGHIHFFKQARRLAKKPYLIVSIARDRSVEKIKGKKPLYGEGVRAGFVRGTGLADKVLLGGLKDHMPHILAEAPHIIALGYDQQGYYVEKTAKYLQDHHKITIAMITLKAYKPEKYKSSLLKSKLS